MGHDRSQLRLLPEAVDDYVGSDNSVRFIDAFVDGLDLAAAGFGRVEPKVTGRPGAICARGSASKLYIYGYLNRVRSSRRLEAETHRNIEAIWLLRHLEAGLQDHRRTSGATTAMRSAKSFFVSLCCSMSSTGPVWPEVAGGGRHCGIKAVNNKNLAISHPKRLSDSKITATARPAGDCPIRSQCTGNQFLLRVSFPRTRPYWTACRPAHSAAPRHPRPTPRDRRAPVPASIKQWMNQGRFWMRGLEKVRAEFSLTALAYNLRRVPQYRRVPRLLIAASSRLKKAGLKPFLPLISATLGR